MKYHSLGLIKIYDTALLPIFIVPNMVSTMLSHRDLIYKNYYAPHVTHFTQSLKRNK